MTLGKRLRIFALSSFDELNHFAKAIGTSPAVISQWFKDVKSPSVLYLEKIYKIGCNINWLLSGEGEMFAPNFAGAEVKRKYDTNSKKDGSSEPIHSNTENEMAEVPLIKDWKMLMQSDLKDYIDKMVELKFADLSNKNINE